MAEGHHAGHVQTFYQHGPKEPLLDTTMVCRFAAVFFVPNVRLAMQFGAWTLGRATGQRSEMLSRWRFLSP